MHDCILLLYGADDRTCKERQRRNSENTFERHVFRWILSSWIWEKDLSVFFDLVQMTGLVRSDSDGIAKKLLSVTYFGESCHLDDEKKTFRSFLIWCRWQDLNVFFCATCRCCAEHTHLGSSFWLKRINQNPWWATSIKNLLAVFYLKNLNQFAILRLSLQVSTYEVFA